jgi:nitrate reductase cytochrome c-type subunit
MVEDKKGIVMKDGAMFIAAAHIVSIEKDVITHISPARYRIYVTTINGRSVELVCSDERDMNTKFLDIIRAIPSR